MLIVLLAASGANADPVGTGFTYQGELRQSGVPAVGMFDLRFRLYDAATGGLQQGPSLCANNIAVADGRFSVELDFGPVFVGQRRWIEIEVREDSGLDCTDGTGFESLSPRQEITAAPHAVQAAAASTADTASTASNALLLGGQPASYFQNAANLTAGTIPNGRIAGSYSSPVTFGSSLNVFAGNGSALASLNASSLSSGTIPGGRLSGAYSNALTLNNAANVFTGSGAGLTSLNASNITAGTLADALHSGNIPRLNASNFFTASANRFAEVNVDVFESNNGTFAGGVLRLGGSGSGEGIASNRTSDLNGNRYGIDFYTNGGTKRMSLTLAGDLGLGEPAPAGRLHARTAGGTITEINTIPTAGDQLGDDGLNPATPQWQSFSPQFSGTLVSIQAQFMFSSLNQPSFVSGLVAQLFVGQGTAGTLLGTAAIAGYPFPNNFPVTHQFTFSPPIALVAEQTYTLSITSSASPPQFSSLLWQGSDDNPNPRGLSRTAFTNPNYIGRDLSLAVRNVVGPLNAFVITPGGDVGIGTTSPANRLDVIGGVLCDHVFQRSSASLKADIRPLEGATRLLLQLSPRRYRLRDPERGGEDIGLVAEEVDGIFPELVAHDADGNALGIKYDRLSVVAIGAMQEQTERLLALERENHELRARLERLEQRLSGNPKR